MLQSINLKTVIHQYFVLTIWLMSCIFPGLEADMRVRIAPILVLGSVLLVYRCSYAQATSTTTTSTATQKGTAIGQTINAAITAALPGVSAVENIISAIFKKPAASVSATTTARVSGQTVKDAVKQNADPTALAAASQAQLTALQGAIEEIATVNGLAMNAQTASTSMTAARALLVTSNWDAFNTQWSVAKTNINKVTNTDFSKLGKISDENVLVVWTTVNQKYVQWMSDVDTNSAKKDLAVTLASFDQLSAAMQSLANVPTIELELISTQLQSVKAQPSSGGAAPTPEPATKGKLAAFVGQTIPASKNIGTSVNP